MKLFIHPSARDTAIAVTQRLLSILQHSKEAFVHVALSGGSTPLQLFRLWADQYRDTLPWQRVHLYWVDERCVAPQDVQSNYGEAKRAFLDHLPLVEAHIHRIHGECDPAEEAARYSSLVSTLLPMESGIPLFDLVILGVGDDGHTGSIFPGQGSLLHSPSIYAVSHNPYSGQERITMTGQPMLHAKCLLFHAVGEGKREILPTIIAPVAVNPLLPAAYIAHQSNHCEFYVDEAAAALMPGLK
ncbi:MAG: 6-phosphogluconolactonase [Phocaeicola sp.]